MVCLLTPVLGEWSLRDLALVQSLRYAENGSTRPAWLAAVHRVHGNVLKRSLLFLQCALGELTPIPIGVANSAEAALKNMVRVLFAPKECRLWERAEMAQELLSASTGSVNRGVSGAAFSASDSSLCRVQ